MRFMVLTRRCGSMSNRLISEVYRRQVGNLAHTAVLALLADKANDDGTGIWASKMRMAEELGTSRQTIITTIKGLTADGLITEIGERRCSNGYTIEYAINVARLRSAPLAKGVTEGKSEGPTRQTALHDPSSSLTGKAPLRVKQDDMTRQAPLRDPSRDLTQTLLNPPEPKKRNTSRYPSNIDQPAHVSDQVWADFIQLRIARKAPVSKTVVDRIAAEARKAGWSMEQALSECIARGWQGFKADWVKAAPDRQGRPAEDPDGFLQHLISSGAVGAGQ